MRLSIEPYALAVCRLSPEEAIPLWASGTFVCICRTPEELSVVCAVDDVPAEVRCEKPFRAIRVAGTLDFALTGILSSIARPLSEAGISIFAISTFDTDYVLVREIELAGAVETLRASGHEVG